MNFRCKVGFHDWQGCKCSACSQIRNSHHEWNGCTCKVCGTVQNNQHDLVGCNCKICGQMVHQWVEESEPCIRCGLVIEIATLDDLEKIRYDLGGHYKLVADIDASDTKNWNNNTGFQPIGNKNNPFTGFLDGKGHSISNLYISSEKDNLGLFSFLKGKVHNIHLLEVNIKGHWYVGGVAGNSSGEILDCKVTGQISGNEDSGSYIGGIVGYSAHSIIAGCKTSLKISGEVFIGGIAGKVEGNDEKMQIVTHCKVKGSIFGGGSIGGVIGCIAGKSTVSHCESLCTINGGYKSQFIGGLIGCIRRAGLYNVVVISECNSVNDIKGDDSIGGLIGYCYDDIKITKCYSVGNVKGENGVGGLVGRCDECNSISDCFSSSNVTGDQDVGGLIGRSNSTKEITNCLAFGKVVGNPGKNFDKGGLIGSYGSGKISNSYWDYNTTNQPSSQGGGHWITTEKRIEFFNIHFKDFVL